MPRPVWFDWLGGDIAHVTEFYFCVSLLRTEENSRLIKDDIFKAFRKTSSHMIQIPQ